MAFTRSRAGRRLLRLLRENGITLTLVDVGASLEPFHAFQPLLADATYIGFDPDRREVRNRHDDEVPHYFLLNKAVVADATVDHVDVFLTRNPTCSSTLLPNHDALDSYLYSYRFDVVDRVTVPATTLAAAVAAAGTATIDWLKLDTQGADLRLLKSIDQQLFRTIMAVDAEPGLDEYYVGEDLFVDLHKEMLERGFWLADVDVVGASRLSRPTFDKEFGTKSKLAAFIYEFSLKQSPVALGPRYLRTLDSMRELSARREDLLRLWACSFFSGNYPYALEVIHACEDAHGQDGLTAHLKKSTVSRNVVYAWSQGWRLARKVRARNIGRLLGKPY